MFISKKGYYFIKVILFFGFSKKESFPIKELSKRLEISEKVLEQVLLSLKNKGLLSSRRGPQGGYWLSSDVSEMTLMDIINITGKKMDIFPIDTGRNPKVIDEVLGDVGEEIEKDVFKKLEEIKVSDLVGILKEKVTETGLNYVI
ncbi:RrF2 family transcriptional regulator [Candidatus Omnitrophota bacterium]